MAKIKALLEYIVKLTAYLDDVVKRGYDLSNWDDLMRILHALQLQAQALIDMAQRAASLLGEPAQTYIEAGETLLRRGIFNAQDLALYRAVVGFRNVLVHGYASLDTDRVDEILKRRLYKNLLALAEKINSRLPDP
ncbi:DUF86 domain-containing protein [Pyrobaculum aerophilum]|uniref:PaREP11 n=1 Tax=Pyrobaculum aerophilum TaxID=13773 RepID=A0A371R1Z7_9CREN|nr:DUF86 domain-containing protein [Pyrobaculum aerophilum]RFA95048.1 hypothetical protein CGL52_13480 [Pyrobaculum aerophilum]RFA97543.1 hypothetical protein CGL51_02505 [Pyrobaculum aerophilum]